MKKSILSLEGVELLSKNEQKSISGGRAAAGTCAAVYYLTDSNGRVHKMLAINASASEAQGWASNGSNGHWCCDSCGSASWL